MIDEPRWLGCRKDVEFAGVLKGCSWTDSLGERFDVVSR